MNWIERLQWRVVDGDTLHCERRNIRLFGYDTPEPRANGLTKEKIWGQVASRRFAELLTEKDRSWWVETSGLNDRYSRTVARLRNTGHPIPAILIEEGLALPYRRGGKRSVWCQCIVRNHKVRQRMREELPLGPNCPQ